MTLRAAQALGYDSRRVVELCGSLSPEEWAAPSGCAGWRVQDAVCHMACVFHSVVDPASIESGPADDAEASAEVAVQARRGWSPEEVTADYRHWAGLGLAAVAALQAAPGGDTVIALGNLGSHPAHLLANALVFDHYCHLRHDIGAAVPRAAALPRDEVALAETRIWMLAGLPQMCRAALAAAVTAPLRLVLDGPGGGSWLIDPAGPDGLCAIGEAGSATGSATVTSTVHDFVAWGTKRQDWRAAGLSIDGDAELASRVLDAVNVI